MAETFKPMLYTKDWNEEWIDIQKERPYFDDAHYWNNRAKSYSSHDAPSAYVDAFLEKAKLEKEESILDMGCGNGALSIPLGKLGFRVIAADFSEGMLEQLTSFLNSLHITTVSPRLMSWSDNWEVHGLTENSVDVAFASRSIATTDLKDSLLRLNQVARKRACITLATGASPRVDEQILKEIKVEYVLGHDFQYAFNILVNEGIKPEVSYIESIRNDSFESLEDAWRALSPMVMRAGKPGSRTDTETKEAFERLREWLKDHLLENPDRNKPNKAGVLQKAYLLDKPRKNTWAFISWKTV